MLSPCVGRNIIYFLLALGIFSIFSLGCCGILDQSNRNGSYYQPYNNQRPSQSPNLDAIIPACNTNIGFSGETTIVYVTLSNTGTAPAENVIVKFNANDMDKPAQDLQLGILPQGKQITISNNVDTKLGVQTTAQITVTSTDSAPIIRYSADCKTLDTSTEQSLDYLVSLGLRAI